MEQPTKLHHVVLLCSFQQLVVGWHREAKLSLQNAAQSKPSAPALTNKKKNSFRKPCPRAAATTSLDDWIRKRGLKAPSEDA